MIKWYNFDGESSDIALCSQTTVSRNIKNYPFPNRMDKDARITLAKSIKAVLTDSGILKKYEITEIELSDLDDLQINSLIKRDILPSTDYSDREGKYLLLSADESVRILLSIEDHINFTVKYAGLSFEKISSVIEEIDSAVTSALPIAFNEKFGFLTENPTILGTAQVSSVIIHLPVLLHFGEISSISESLMHIGLSITPIFDKTDESGFYKITNNITLGITERDSVNNLYAICNQLAERERNARKASDRIYLEDKAFRSSALIKSAKRISYLESIKLLSDLKLGITVGIIKNIDEPKISGLITSLSDESLKAISHNENDYERFRAEYIQNTLVFKG